MPLIALLISWSMVTTDCHGNALQFPEQVTYAVPYRIRWMAPDPNCPADLDGMAQLCATYDGTGEWATPGLSLDVDQQSNPPLGAVYEVGEPIAVTPLHRSTETCQ